MLYYHNSNLRHFDLPSLNFQDRYKFMQYTGLNDINNVEIYEGDILLGKDWGQKERYKGPVVWQVTEFIVKYKNLRNKTWTQLTNLAEPKNLEEWEIIGNIYENPDLLEKL